MVINYLGGGSLKLQSGPISLLVNPENNRFKADIVLKTLSPSRSEEEVGQGEISFSGEYEIKEVEVSGIQIVEESTDKFLKTVYLVKWEEIKIAFLGHISKFPPASVIEKLGEPDVLILPVGGGHFLEPDVAAKLVRQLEPSYVIPTFYKDPKDFLKAIGQKGEAEEKLVFKKKDLVGIKNKVVILKA